MANWAVSSEDARLLRAERALVRVPVWFAGGDPAGIAPLAGWSVQAAEDGAGWLARNNEAERGKLDRCGR